MKTTLTYLFITFSIITGLSQPNYVDTTVYKINEIDTPPLFPYSYYNSPLDKKESDGNLMLFVHQNFFVPGDSGSMSGRLFIAFIVEKAGI